ncbi:hypothetical protein BDZ91DRAFT_795030 [Kalaharituber pfeilii]|nr:hypothetical protein BDZ91DRAFT_795030 [Kalaharituber pfeilii]
MTGEASRRHETRSGTGGGKECKEVILNGTSLSNNPTFKPVFVDWNGNPKDKEHMIGVDYKTCISYCGNKSEKAQWSTFAPQFTAWLLPFIALTAQFPYQASTTWGNLMSGIITVGSPALATFSLVLTFLNARWIHKRCAETVDLLPKRTFHDREKQKIVKSIFKSMKKVLSVAQQEPYERVQDIRISNDLDGDLLWDEHWWKMLAAAVQKTKRGYTASFVHQLLWVNIAFAFSMVDAFGSENIGNNATAFGLAIALVWQWETPIVMGWVLVGTQAVDNGVRTAIAEINDPNRNAINGLLPRATGFFEPYQLHRIRGDIQGDRRRTGPISNYARHFVWIYRADFMVEFYRRVVDPSLSQISIYMENESKWKRVSFVHIVYATGLALLLQWSTAGASVFLNYLTPTQGLACRSGGILIYAVNATLILFLILASSLISEYWAAEKYYYGPKRRLRWYEPLSLVGYIAILLRTIGKFLAIVNAAWICVHCLLEFTNFYENCWCKTTYFERGESGYWVLGSDAELRQYANITEVWGGASALAIMIPTLFVAFFMVAHHHYKL